MTKTRIIDNVDEKQMFNASKEFIKQESELYKEEFKEYISYLSYWVNNRDSGDEFVLNKDGTTEVNDCYKIIGDKDRPLSIEQRRNLILEWDKLAYKGADYALDSCGNGVVNFYKNSGTGKGFKYCEFRKTEGKGIYLYDEGDGELVETGWVRAPGMKRIDICKLVRGDAVARQVKDIISRLYKINYFDTSNKLETLMEKEKIDDDGLMKKIVQKWKELGFKGRDKAGWVDFFDLETCLEKI